MDEWGKGYHIYIYRLYVWVRRCVFNVQIYFFLRFIETAGQCVILPTHPPWRCKIWLHKLHKRFRNHKPNSTAQKKSKLKPHETTCKPLKAVRTRNFDLGFGPCVVSHCLFFLRFKAKDPPPTKGPQKIKAHH